MRDQGVFQLEHLLGQPPHAAVDVGVVLPGRLSRDQVQFDGLRLHQHCQLGAFGGLRRQRAPAPDRGLQLVQALVQPGLGHRRGQVADQRGTGAALGDGAFGRVVRRVEVDVGQVGDQPVGPAVATHAALLAGHELQRAMGAEVQHRMGLEVLAQVAVEGRERVGGRQAFLEQQAHRVALVAERGLHRHQHVAELLAEHEDGAAVAELPARRGAPLGLDLGQPALAPHMVVGGDQRVHVGVGAVLLGVAAQHRLAQGVDAGGHVHRVAAGLHAGQGVEHRLEHRQVGGAADVAGVGREVEDHHRHLARAALAAAQRHQLGHPGGQHQRALGAGVHVLRRVAGLEHAVVVAAAAGDAGRARPATEDDRPGGAVELGDRHHDGALHRQQAAVGAAPLVERLELHRLRGDVGHVQPGQHVLGRLGIVVGRPADQREAGQRDHRVHRHAAVLDEETFDRRA